MPLNYGLYGRKNNGSMSFAAMYSLTRCVLCTEQLSSKIASGSGDLSFKFAKKARKSGPLMLFCLTS